MRELSAVCLRPLPGTVGVRVVFLAALLLLFGLLHPITANAAGSPTGAVAAAWPAAWNEYRFVDGTHIADTNTDQNPNTLDLASGTCAGACIGPDATVQYYSDGTTAFFRIRMAVDLTDNTKGGLVGGAFLTQIAVGGTVVAVVGVDGKSSSVDTVYVATAPGAGTIIYNYPFDNTGGQTSGGMRMVAAGDGSGNYFLDYQVPVSAITTVSSGAVTASTPIQLFYGSSAAANLATINKDFMTGSNVSFVNLATVSLLPAALSLSSNAVSLSGTNPPTADATSTYTVTVSASNPGGGDLSSTTVSIPLPAGVTASSLSTASGTLTGSSTLTWDIGTILPGATKTATFVASITPTAGQAGSTLTLVSLQSGSGSDIPGAATRTATSAAITVGPVAAAPTRTVSFDSQGGTSVTSQSVTQGSLATTPTAPTRSGYTLNGWYTASSGGSLWNFASNTVSSDMTLYAQWTPINYTVTFNSQGGSSVGSQSVAYGAQATEPTAPTLAGNTFLGWFTASSGGSLWNFSTGTVTGDMTLYAHWSLNDYTVAFDSQGGTSVGSQTVTYGGTATEPADPTRTGFTFDGWFTAASGGSLWNFTTGTISGNQTLYAQWTAIGYTVTFDSQGGTLVSSQGVSYGSLATEPTAPTRTGYTFGGWYTAASGGSLWNFATDTVTGDLTLYASWTPVDYTVTFDSQGGTSVGAQTIAYGDLAMAPTPPSLTGYTLSGWFTASSGGSLWDFSTDTVAGDTTLYAQWAPIDYTVTFDSQGGSSVGSETVAYASLATLPSDPTRTGYSFDGWFTASSGGALWDFATTAVTGDTTLYAQWTVTDYTVSFDSQGGSLVAGQLVSYGGTATAPLDPTLSGYTFDGWFTAVSGGSLWDFTTNVVTGDTTLYASWTPIDYTVTFDSQGGSAVASQTVAYGDIATQPGAPTRPGYTFNGWFTASSGGSLWDFSTDTVGGDATLYAQWTPINLSLVFDSQGGTPVAGQTVAYDTLATQPGDPTRTGQSFDGWFTAPSGGTLWDFSTATVTAPTTLYAQWTPVDYTVAFDSQGGSVVGDQTVAYGDPAGAPTDPTKAGSSFDGWFTAPSGGSLWDFPTDLVTGNTTLYAQWTPVDHTVTFDSQGGTAVGPATVSDGALLPEPTVPTQVGYTFSGWYTASSGGSLWDFGSDTVTADTTLYAQWVAVTNDVTFDSQGGSFVAGATVVTGDPVPEPANPTRYGYSFDGWFTAASGGVLWDFVNDTVSGDMFLYAQWTVADFTVTYDSQGGSAVSPEGVAYGATATEPVDPTLAGYSFDGWFTAASGGSLWDFPTNVVTANQTLYAQWTPVDYSVTFNSQGGSAVSGQTVANGSLALDPAAPSRTGYTFDGWFTAGAGGSLWNFGTDTISSDTTLYAQWTSIDYQVTFDSQGGTAVSGQTVAYGFLVTAPSDPTRTGHTFDGWFTSASGGLPWTFGLDTISADTTLYAQWTAIDYTVTFNSQGGSAVGDQTVAYGDTASVPTPPTRSGYTFLGWHTASSGGSLWSFATNTVTGDTTLYAQWGPVNYSVTFDSQGGSGVGGQTVANGGVAIDPGAPGRTGYTFDGWFTASSGGSAWSFGTDAVSGDTTLYAQWTVVNYPVTFDSQGGSAVAGQSVPYGGVATEPTAPTRTGQNFDGWFNAPSGGVLWDFATDTVTSATTVYAQWTPVDYTVSFDSQGGSAVADQTVAYGGLATEPTNPTRAGYTFDGWFTATSGGSLWDFTADTINGDRTLYATWTPIDYSVTFDSQGGTPVGGQTISYGTVATEPSAPTRTGYTFDGWFDSSTGGSAWNFATDPITGDTTIYAQWTILTFPVTFDSQGGSAVAGQVIDYDTLVTEPSNPTLANYTFQGWFTTPSGGTLWDFSTGTITSATTLYAEWAPVDYTVSFDSQGGSSVPDETVAFGGTATMPSAPSQTGYTFDGWFTASSGGSVWNFATGTITGDTTLYAQWTAIDYTVTFDSQGGTSVPDQTVSYGGLVTAPSDPTRTGYAFTGWWDSASGGTLWDFPTDTVTGGTALYAQWSINDYAVTFDSQGGSTVVGQAVTFMGLVIEPPSDPVRLGFAFDGWTTASSGGSLWDFALDTVSNDMTLYAQWTALSFVSFNSQGGTSVDGQFVLPGDLVDPPTPPVRTGYTFLGWYTAPTGGTLWDFVAGTAPGDMVLYAQWAAVGGLASTGAPVQAQILAMLALIGAGVLMMILGRRPRRATVNAE